ncbi:MAG: D-alanine--D-alanine ligase [Candidatus Hydrogenedentota bacterium]
MEKLHIAVISGGVSAEHDVSLQSGKLAARNLDPSRFAPTPIIIEKDGQWRLGGAAPCPIFEAIGRLPELSIDCAFLALHGPNGEDGRIQGLLDLLGIPYTGSPCAASALGMDKIRSKALLAHHGVAVAPDMLVDVRRWRREPSDVQADIGQELGYPCVVKSPCEGSSLGMGIPHGPGELSRVLDHVFTFGETALVEGYVEGTELTCGVLETEPGEPPMALPVTEIRPVSSRYFDYQAKYTPGATEEITPAPIPDTLREKAQSLAVQAHELIGCRGFSRSDMIVRDGGPVWIEINTIPGLTDVSLFPQAAAAAGFPYADMAAKLIDVALARAQNKDA